MSPSRRRAVFLDRDGVLNEVVLRDGRPHPPASADELKLFPDACAQLQRLKERGFLLICVSNQPDVARGNQSRDAVEAMNARLRSDLPLDDLLVCYHDDVDRCSCRKPAPGLLLEAANRHAIDRSASFMIGDRWRDVQAGQRAACTSILIECGYRDGDVQVQPDHRVRSLAEAVDWILARVGGGGTLG